MTTEKEQKVKTSIKRTKQKTTVNETIEENREAFTFFMGAIVGLLGGASISALFEFSKGVFAQDPIYMLSFWGFMSTFAGVGFFQLTKKMLLKIGITKELWVLDRACIGIVLAFTVAILINIILRT